MHWRTEFLPCSQGVQRDMCITNAIRAYLYLFLITLSPISVAAEKIPLNTFLNDLRYQLYAGARGDSQEPLQTVVKNVHVEINVVVEKDPQGRPVYYVLDGVIDRKDVVTQKISFDMVLQNKSSANTGHSGSRVYSTRRREVPYGAGRYPPSGQYPAYPGPYMPDIYPVILFDRHR